MFVGIRGSRQVTVGPIFVGAVGGAAVVLLTGWGAVILIRAGLYVAMVIFRHLQTLQGYLQVPVFSLKVLSCTAALQMDFAF